ncbi:hypothetical protein LINPERHAP2_LOCUS9733 [Linum perenne]
MRLNAFLLIKLTPGWSLAILMLSFRWMTK